jgi:hypothetical protein
MHIPGALVMVNYFMVQVYKGLNIESGEVVAVKQVQLNVINTEQLDSARPCYCCTII